jgi:hypothetical protein
VKVTFGTKNHEFGQLFKTAGYFTYCKDIDGLMDAMHMSSGDYSLMLQRQVPKQSSYTMEISCLPFLGHMLPAQKKCIQL